MKIEFNWLHTLEATIKNSVERHIADDYAQRKPFDNCCTPALGVTLTAVETAFGHSFIGNIRCDCGKNIAVVSGHTTRQPLSYVVLAGTEK